MVWAMFSYLWGHFEACQESRMYCFLHAFGNVFLSSRSLRRLTGSAECIDFYMISAWQLPAPVPPQPPAPTPGTHFQKQTEPTNPMCGPMCGAMCGYVRSILWPRAHLGLIWGRGCLAQLGCSSLSVSRARAAVFRITPSSDRQVELGQYGRGDTWLHRA